MELIKKQDAIKALRDTFLGDTYEIDEVACETIEGLKTVEAIPIEFIEEFIQGIIQTRDKQIQDISKWRHFDDNIVVLVALLDSWKEEQEKNNGNQ